jgi:hypothetical protein
MSKTPKFLSTQECGVRLGMSSEWIRRQILAGRLHAVAYRTTSRPVYRVTESSLAAFRLQFSGDAALLPDDDSSIV